MIVNITTFANVYNTFFAAGEVVEIRAFGLRGKGPWQGFVGGGGGVVYGYFNEAEAFGKAAAALEQAAEGQSGCGVYFTLNPVVPDYLYRAPNLLKAAGAKDKTTSDKDVLVTRWLPIDLDPVRFGGPGRAISSDLNTTEEEFKAAWEARNQIHEALRSEFGAPAGIPALSGNGAHLLFRLPDLPSGDDTERRIRKALAGLAARFNTPQVGVDVKVFNSARIWKLYGTTARKGYHSENRPQRESRIQFNGEGPPVLSGVEVADEGLLDRLGALAPEEPKPKPSPSQRPREASGTSGNGAGDLGPMNVGAYLSHYGIPYEEKPNEKHAGGRLFVLRNGCLFNPEHKFPEAGIAQGSDGRLWYQCFHDSCNGRTWRDARTAISGEDILARWCEGYQERTPPPIRGTRPAPVRRPVEPKGDDDGDGGRPDDDAAPPSGGGTATIGDDWDLSAFIKVTKSGRTLLDHGTVAPWFRERMGHICCEGDERAWWRYDDSGIWKPHETGLVKRFIHQVLGVYSRPAWVTAIHDQLAHECFLGADERGDAGDLLNLVNGMYDIDTDSLLPHSPEYHSRVQIPVNYDQDAECPLWGQTLRQIFSDDKTGGRADLLQEFAGYCLIPKLYKPAVLFAIGDGRNGKGVVDHVLSTMLGQDNVCHVSLRRMEDRFGAIEIKDKLLNSVSETETGLLDVTKFKQVSAGDELQAERKNLSDVKFRPYAKHYIAMNAFPRLSEVTDSFFRRIMVLEFRQRFEGANDDPRLKEKLEAEMDGIFMWALLGLASLRDREWHFAPTADMGDAMDRFRSNSNHLLPFVNEACLIGKEFSARPQSLYRCYKTWCADANVRPRGRNKFYEQLMLSFPSVTRNRASKGEPEMFHGIAMAVPEREERDCGWTEG